MCFFPAFFGAESALVKEPLSVCFVPWIPAVLNICPRNRCLSQSEWDPLAIELEGFCWVEKVFHWLQVARNVLGSTTEAAVTVLAREPITLNLGFLWCSKASHLLHDKAALWTGFLHVGCEVLFRKGCLHFLWTSGLEIVITEWGKNNCLLTMNETQRPTSDNGRYLHVWLCIFLCVYLETGLGLKNAACLERGNFLPLYPGLDVLFKPAHHTCWFQVSSDDTWRRRRCLSAELSAPSQVNTWATYWRGGH